MFRLLARLARAARPRRRWLQFSVGTLLLGTTACAVVLGIVTERARDQRALVKAIERTGGRVTYAHQLTDDDGPRESEEQLEHKSLLSRWLGDDYAEIVAIQFGAREPPDEDFTRATRLTQLRFLWSRHNIVDDRRLLEMRGLKRLRQVVAHGSRITDAGLAGVQDMRELRKVYLANTLVRGPGLVHLADKTDIEELQLGYCPLEDEGLRHLAGLTALKTLFLDGTDITDRGLAHLARLDSLKDLTLTNTRITDEGLVHLAGLTNLICLRLSGTAVTGPGLAHLAGLPKLMILDLDGTQVDDEGLAHLAKLPNLQSLSLGGTPLTGAGFAPPGGFSVLVHLSLNDAGVDDDGAERLAAIPSLRNLELSRTRVGDRGASHLARLPLLETLRLNETPVGDAGGAALAQAPALRNLSLARSNVGDEGLVRLGSAQVLVELDLNDCPVTDAGLDRIVQRGLKLQLTGTSVTETAVDRFHNRFPGFPTLRETWFACARRGRSTRLADLEPLEAIGETDTAEKLWERAATLSLMQATTRYYSKRAIRGKPVADLFAAAIERSTRPAPIFVAWGDLEGFHQNAREAARQAIEAHLDGHPERELLEYVLQRGDARLLCHAAAGAIEPEYAAPWERLAAAARQFTNPQLPLEAFARRDPHNALAYYYRAEGLRETATLEELLEWLQAGHDAARVEGYPTPMPPSVLERSREPAESPIGPDEPWVRFFMLDIRLDNGFQGMPWANREPWGRASWTLPNADRRLRFGMARMFARLRDGAASQQARADNTLYAVRDRFVNDLLRPAGGRSNPQGQPRLQNANARLQALLTPKPPAHLDSSAAPLRALLPEILAAKRKAADKFQRELAKHGFDGPLDWLADLEE